MKRILTILLAFTLYLTGVLCSCRRMEPIVIPDPELMIDTTLVVSSSGGTERLTIKSGYDWTASKTEGGDWCTFSPESGAVGSTTIEIRTTENEETEIRSARIDLKSENGSGIIRIVQQQIEVLDLAVDSRCSFGPEGGTFAVRLDYNVDLAVSCEADWVQDVTTKAYQHEIMTFAVDKNPTGEDRTCTISFTGGRLTRTVTVSQQAPFMNLSVNEASVSAEAAEIALTVVSNVPYDFVLPENDWLSLAGVTSTRSGDFASASDYVFAAKGNDLFFLREAQIDFIGEEYGLSGSLHILQQAMDIMTAELPPLELGAEGGLFAFDVNPSREYQISAGELTWITVGTAEGSPARRIITVARNATDSDRSGTVSIKSGEQTREIAISQTGARVEATPDKYTFGTAGGSHTLSVAATVPFELVPDGDASWCTVESVSASQFIICTEANSTEAARSCIISLVNKEFGINVSVPVEQLQKDVFEISPRTFEFGPEGGPMEIAVHSNIDFDVTCDAGWIAEDEAARTDSQRTYVVSLNNTESGRWSLLTFSSGPFEAVVSVSQVAAVIAAKEHLFKMDQTAHQFSFETESNVAFNVKATEEWITIDEIAESSLSFSVADNQTTEDRSGSIILYNDNYPASDTVKVVQRAHGFLDFEQTEFLFDPMGGRFALELATNKEYTYSITDSPDWIQEVAPMVFEVSTNTSGEDRTCTIVFEQDDLREVITVTQDKPYLQLDTDTLTFTADGGTQSVKLYSNVQVEVILPYEEWAVFRSMKDSTISVTVGPNQLRTARECTLVVVNRQFDLRAQATVHQDWKEFFNILTPEFNFGPCAAQFEVKVHTNMEYIYAPDVTWIEVASDNLFTISDNLTDEDRDGTVTYTVGETTYQIAVHQEHAYLDISPESFAVDSVGGQIAVNVSTNVDYRVDLHEADWIYDSGRSDAGEHLFDVVRNRTRESRSCQVDFISDLFSITRTVAIDQTGIPFFDVEKEEYTLGPSDTEVRIVHTSCDDVTMNISDSPWIRELEDLRTDTQLVFELDTNFNDQARVASMALTGNGLTVLVTVMQNPPILEMSLDHKSVGADGERVVIDLTSNFIPELSFSDDWVSGNLSSDGKALVLVVAENTTGLQRTATVTLGSTELRSFKEITITQAANLILELSPASYEIGAEGGSFLVTVTSNVTYSLLSLTEWLTYASTEDKDVFEVIVEPNPSTTARSATLFFRSVGIQTTLNLNQEGRINENYYRSTDFSADGTVKRLQEATEGNGVPLIIMGDAFSDRMIADGTYDNCMNKAMEAFFGVEPFKTFRNMFDVYSVTLVSTNEIIADDSKTALSTYFSSSTVVGGSREDVRNKASLARPGGLSDALIIVIMNSETYAGTTYMYSDENQPSDYGLGEAIAYIPLCTSEEEFTQVIQHEAGGHGFGKLEDEYSYKSMGPITDERKGAIVADQRLGYYKNVDFTSNLQEIRWAKFISDQRYRYDEIGAYEGACTYYTGVWRPTEESIMRHNTGKFNAPSREAIYYRIHKLAYGDSWQYSYEDFVSYDSINRNTAPQGSNTFDHKKSEEDDSGRPVLPHPIMIRE